MAVGSNRLPVRGRHGHAAAAALLRSHIARVGARYQGQYNRLVPGGDHNELLGIGDRIDDFVDVPRDGSSAKYRAAIRQKSGGRAVTFLVDDEYVTHSGHLLTVLAASYSGV